MALWTPITLAHALELNDAMRHEACFVESLDPHLKVELQSPTRRTFTRLHDGRPIAELDTERLGEDLWLAVWIDPRFRRQGIASSGLQFADRFASNEGLRQLRGSVDPANLASLALLRAAGFEIAEAVDDDGLIAVHRQVSVSR